MLLENSNAKFHELSLKELDLARRLIKFIQLHEYEEFWVITQCNENDLPNLLMFLDAGKDKIKNENESITMKFDFHHDLTLNRAIWYAYNFDDYFEDEFESEFNEICDLYDKINGR